MTPRTVDLDRIARVSAGLTVAGAAAALAAGRLEASSTLFGGLFMAVNYRLIRMLVSMLIAPGASRGAALALLLGKSLLLGLLVVGVMLQFPIAPMWFALGASMLPLAAVLDAVLLGTPIPPDAEQSQDPEHAEQ